jgi:ribonuclease P protein component
VPGSTLRGRSNIRRVLGSGQARRSDGIVLHWAASGQTESRYAVAAKTSVGGAVVRNRVRRWARELLRRWGAAITPGHDLVVIAHNREAALSFAMFAYHLRRVLVRAELMHATEGAGNAS